MSLPAATATSPPEADRVARVLATLAAGARLRQAERAVLTAAEDVAGGGRPGRAGGPSALDALVVEVRQREFVHEPVAFSPRPGVGRLLVLARRAMFKLFMKWYLHPVLQQQNAFNQATSRTVAELAAETARLRAELAALLRGPRGEG